VGGGEGERARDLWPAPAAAAARAPSLLCCRASFLTHRRIVPLPPVRTEPASFCSRSRFIYKGGEERG
jgi:hypothetical protein